MTEYILRTGPLTEDIFIDALSDFITPFIRCKDCRYFSYSMRGNSSGGLCAMLVNNECAAPSVPIHGYCYLGEPRNADD